MPGIGTINLKVVILDTDYYALQAINSYLAWDRRTRVTGLVTSEALLWDHLRLTARAEMPDVLLFDADNIGGAGALEAFLHRLHDFVQEIMVICLVQRVDPELVDVAAEMGAAAFLLKQDVQLQITWAIIHALEADFLVTSGVARQTRSSSHPRVHGASILPERRVYPEMSDRIRQAIKLCVIEGMPAHLAADEMGISLHTIRGYIKDGYRILESHDHFEYPTDMTPQERAFMRFTALAESDL